MIRSRLQRVGARLDQLDARHRLEPGAERCLHDLVALFGMAEHTIPRDDVARDWRFMEILPWLVQTGAPTEHIAEDLHYWEGQSRNWGDAPWFAKRYRQWFERTDHRARYIDPLWYWSHSLSRKARTDLWEAVTRAACLTLGDDAASVEMQDAVRWLITLAHARHRWPDDASDDVCLVHVGRALAELHEELRAAPQRDKAAQQWAKEVQQFLDEQGADADHRSDDA